MKYWRNVPHCQFDLLLGGAVQQVIGQMVDVDETGATILLESNQQLHSYTWAVIQHICKAP